MAVRRPFSQVSMKMSGYFWVIPNHRQIFTNFSTNPIPPPNQSISEPLSRPHHTLLELKKKSVHNLRGLETRAARVGKKPHPNDKKWNKTSLLVNWFSATNKRAREDGERRKLCILESFENLLLNPYNTKNGIKHSLQTLVKLKLVKPTYPNHTHHL